VKTLGIDHVTVATPDAATAQATFQRHFGLIPAPVKGSGSSPEPTAAALVVGGAQIVFITPAAGTALATALATGGEGMAALCLEVADLDDAVEALRHAGVRLAVDTSSGSRVVQVDPAAAHGVRLALIEQRHP
jgi:catechol 2,3-dioxygenase-like lactoylglutathione lyase family enzyme